MNKIRQEARRKQWMEHVSAWRRSGLTQSGYCRLHGLAVGTFNAWISREKKMSVEQTTRLTLVPVVVQSAADRTPLNSPLTLQHSSGWHVHLPADTPAKWFGEVLNELS